mgnify:FL=1
MVPVAPAPLGGGAAGAMKLKVPDAPEVVSVPMVTDPLPARLEPVHVPVTVLPLVVRTLTVALPDETWVVVLPPPRTAKFTETVSAALLLATVKMPFV